LTSYSNHITRRTGTRISDLQAALGTRPSRNPLLCRILVISESGSMWGNVVAGFRNEGLLKGV